MPPPLGGNKFNSTENWEENQSERNHKKLTMILWFMDMFPVFDEFLLYFHNYLSILSRLTQLHAKYWKIFGASRHLQLFFAHFRVENTTFFWRFAPFAKCHGDFHWCWHEKKSEEISIFLFKEGEKLEILTKIFTRDRNR